MPGMALRHDVVVVPDPGGAVVGHRPVDRDVFSEDVVVPDRDPRSDSLRVVATGLGSEPDRGERVDRASRADAGATVDPDITDGPRPGSDRDRPGDRAARADLDVVREGHISVDDGCWVNLGHGRILNNSAGEVPTPQQLAEKAASLEA